MSQDKEQLTSHNYDGIQELDNPLPNWWLMTFLGTIIFSGLYYLHYESGTGQTQLAELEAELNAIKKIQKQVPEPSDSDEVLMQLLSSTEHLDIGKGVYESKCAACHGPQLQGLIGPNLTDEFWLHGTGKPSEIARVVRIGVLEKGMPPWADQLKDEEIKAVTVYIAKNLGSNPPNPKDPQGEKGASF